MLGLQTPSIACRAVSAQPQRARTELMVLTRPRGRQPAPPRAYNPSSLLTPFYFDFFVCWLVCFPTCVATSSRLHPHFISWELLATNIYGEARLCSLLSLLVQAELFSPLHPTYLSGLLYVSHLQQCWNVRLADIPFPGAQSFAKLQLALRPSYPSHIPCFPKLPVQLLRVQQLLPD